MQVRVLLKLIFEMQSIGIKPFSSNKLDSAFDVKKSAICDFPIFMHDGRGNFESIRAANEQLRSRVSHKNRAKFELFEKPNLTGSLREFWKFEGLECLNPEIHHGKGKL